MPGIEVFLLAVFVVLVVASGVCLAMCMEPGVTGEISGIKMLIWSLTALWSFVILGYLLIRSA